MPRYDYKCVKCEREFEAYAKIADRLDVKCINENCGGATKILISRPNLAIFMEGWYEDISDRPIYIQTPQQLREACDNNGAYSRYLKDTGYWKTSPGESLEERAHRESRVKGTSEADDASSGEGHGIIL